MTTATPTICPEIAAYNAMVRANRRYLVIERATGLPLGGNEPLSESYARHVVAVRDAFRDGSFYLKQVG